MTHTIPSTIPSASAGQAMDRSAAGEAAIDDAAISDAVIDAATMDAATLSGMQSEMLRVGVASVNQVPLDWDGNQQRLEQVLAAARSERVQVLCLPELCISGYGCEDAFYSENVAAEAWRVLGALLPHTKGMVVGLGLPLLHRENLFNGAALLVDGRLAGLVAKRVLAGDGVHYEPRWFRPWPRGLQQRYHAPPLSETSLVDPVQEGVPLGELRFVFSGTIDLGFEICEEAWQLPVAIDEAEPPQIILNLSASHFALGKYDTLRRLVAERARHSRAIYLYANLLGNEAGRLIYDGALLIASQGEVIAEAPRLTLDPWQLCCHTVDGGQLRLERRRQYRARYRYLESAAGRVELSHALLPARLEGDAFASPSSGPVAVTPAMSPSGTTSPGTTSPGTVPPGTTSPLVVRPLSDAAQALEPSQEFVRAVSLGLWDYLRKSGAAGLVLSLSGGVDSASVGVLVAVTIARALESVPPSAWTPQLRSALLRSPSLGSPSPEAQLPLEERRRQLVARLLLTIYQAGTSSSAWSRDAAAAVAQALGARHLEWNLGSLIESYEALAAEALGRPLRWNDDDLARQNIQARVRAPGPWLMANLERRLLLCTSNRSEVGVGYMTMDGDSCGGLAPLAGVSKVFLQDWLRGVEREGVEGWLPPLPALHAVNAHAPTAELRPVSPGAKEVQAQRDEVDLMPYPLLACIEEQAIGQSKGPLQVWRALLANPPAELHGDGDQLTPQQAASYVIRFFVLWAGSQWKRERLAPSFHLDDKNLDPRGWCRFPILNGGYRREIEQLRRAAYGSSRGSDFLQEGDPSKAEGLPETKSDR